MIYFAHRSTPRWSATSGTIGYCMPCGSPPIAPSTMSTIPELKPWREVAMEKALKASEARVRELEEERRNAWSKARSVF